MKTRKPHPKYKEQRVRDKKKARAAVKHGFKFRVVWEWSLSRGDFYYLERLLKELAV